MSNSKKEIGERLKEIRKDMSLTQEAFGQLFDNIDKSTISKYEKGISDIAQKVLVELFTTHKVNRDWLINGIGEKYKEADYTSLKRTNVNIGFLSSFITKVKSIFSLEEDEELQKQRESNLEKQLQIQEMVIEMMAKYESTIEEKNIIIEKLEKEITLLKSKLSN